MSAILQTAGRGSSSLGPELITNGTFPANILGWTPFGSPVLTWDAGRLLLDPIGNTEGVGQTGLTMPVGNYRVAFDWQVIGWLSGNVLSYLAGSSVGNSSGFGSNFPINNTADSGSFVTTIACVIPSLAFTIQVNTVDAVNTRLWLDNISVRQVI